MADNRYFKTTSATFRCEICNKLTRDTGHYEATLALCKRCLFTAYVENTRSDYGVDSPEHREAVANLAGLGPAKAAR